MRILSLDTTTGCGSVALLDNARLLAEINAESGLTHSARLLRTVDFLLKKNGLEIKDLDGFAVAAGPGSFTGIRIGLSTIKAFAFASRKPAAPVSTLAALALKLRETQGRLFCPFLDAKKGEVYAALYEPRDRELKAVIGEGAYGPDAFLSALPAHRVIHFIGNGVDVFDLDADQHQIRTNTDLDMPIRQFFVRDPDGNLIEFCDAGNPFFKGKKT